MVRCGATSSDGALVVRCEATCSGGAEVMRSGATSSDGALGGAMVVLAWAKTSWADGPRHLGRMGFVLKRLDCENQAQMMMDPYQ